MEVSTNDFSVYGGTFHLCLENQTKVLRRCEGVNLVLNWKKYHIMVQEGVVLGYVLSNRGIEVDKAKIEVFEQLLAHASVKGVRSFFGHMRFYCRFIKEFSKMTKPLT